MDGGSHDGMKPKPRGRMAHMDTSVLCACKK